MTFEYSSKIIVSLKCLSQVDKTSQIECIVRLVNNSLLGYCSSMDNPGINVSDSLRLTGENIAKESYDMALRLITEIDYAIQDLRSA